MEAGALPTQAAIEPLPLPPSWCDTHRIWINSIIKRGTVSSKRESSRKDSEGNVISLWDEGLFIPNKMKLLCLLSDIYACATCSADMFTKWLSLKNVCPGLLWWFLETDCTPPDLKRSDRQYYIFFLLSTNAMQRPKPRINVSPVLPKLDSCYFSRPYTSIIVQKKQKTTSASAALGDVPFIVMNTGVHFESII